MTGHHYHQPEPLAVSMKRCTRLPVTATKAERIAQHQARMAFKKERDQYLTPGLYPGHLWRLPS